MEEASHPDFAPLGLTNPSSAYTEPSTHDRRLASMTTAYSRRGGSLGGLPLLVALVVAATSCTGSSPGTPSIPPTPTRSASGAQEAPRQGGPRDPPFLGSGNGWQTISTGDHLDDESYPLTWATNETFDDRDLVSVVGGAFTASRAPYYSLPLDSGQVLIVAGLVNPSMSPPPDSPTFPPRDLPLDLHDADVQGEWEGQPSASMCRYVLLSAVNRRYVELRAYFGGGCPNEDVLADAQAEVATLAVPTSQSCDPDLRYVWHTKMVPWLTSVLVEVGSTDGNPLGQSDIDDTGSALQITDAHDEVTLYVHASVPDPEHDPRPNMVKLGSSGDYDLYASGQGKVRRFGAFAPTTWLTLGAYAETPAVTSRWESDTDVRSWLDRMIGEIAINPVPSC